MTKNSDEMENVTIALTAEIKVRSGSWDHTTLVEVKRYEMGKYSLHGAMKLLEQFAGAVIQRCGERVNQRIVDATRQITTEEGDDGAV